MKAALSSRKARRLSRAGLVVLAVTCIGGVGAAQTSTSRIVPRDRPDQAAAPNAPPAAPAAAPLAPAPQIAPFTLSEVRIDGSSLPPEVLARATSPFIGRTLGQQQLQELTDAVAAAYRTSDVALYTVLVPDQDLSRGSLRLTVVEGHISATEVSGLPPGADTGRIDAYSARLQSERPLSRRTLEREVSLIRDIPGLRPRIELAEGSEEGAMRLRVEAQPRNWQVGAAVNNRGALFLGRTQAQFDIDRFSALRQGDQTRLTLAFPTDTERFQYLALSHSQPVGTKGAYVGASAGYLRTRPTSIPVRGEARSLGLTYSRPLVRSYSRNLYLNVGLDGLNSDNALLGQTISDERTRAMRGLLAYTHAGERHSLNLNGGVSGGLDAFGARVSGAGFSEVEFTKFNVRVAYDRMLGRSVIIRARAVGQHSSDRLPASEQMALGGEAFGRAYESAFVAGDKGYAGSLELAWRPAGTPDRWKGSEVYAFADRGRTTYNERPGLPGTSRDIASVGAGVRILANERLQIDLEAARGLENPIPSIDRKEWRGVVAVKSVF